MGPNDVRFAATAPIPGGTRQMTETPMLDEQRNLAVKRIMSMGGSRRDMLKVAAAAGLIPVLTSAQAGAALAASQEGGTPVRGGTFVTLGHETIETLSPENSSSTVPWVTIIQLFDSLYQIDEQFQLVPVLAESFEPSADGLTYTFKLRTGVTFHNGDAFSSADVKYTYDWIKDPANGSIQAGAFQFVSTVEAPDPQTVVVTLTEADVTFMVSVAPTMILPSAYHAEVGEEAFSAAPIGTGPYFLADPADFVPAQKVVLTANESYFRGRSNFDTYQIDIVPEAAGRMAALESGQADNSIWSLNGEDSITLEESGDFQVLKVLNNAVNHFVINNEAPVFADVNVRKALLHASDRSAFLEDVYRGLGVLATSHLSPNVEKYYNPNVTTYDFNIDTANKILDEAGWVRGDGDIREKDGVRLEFTLAVIQGDTQRRPEAEVAQQSFKEIGVDMQIEESTAVTDGMMDGTFIAALFNWVYGGGNGEPDARDTLGSTGANNFSHYKNAEVDQLLQDGVLTLIDEERISIYNRIQEIVAEEVPFLYFLHPMGYAFYANHIGGVPAEVLSSDNLYYKTFAMWKNAE
jgi:peptide/nickel transport system substrate-binding protein